MAQRLTMQSKISSPPGDIHPNRISPSLLALSRSGLGKDFGRFAGGPSRFPRQRKDGVAGPRFPSRRIAQVFHQASAIRALKAGRNSYEERKSLSPKSLDFARDPELVEGQSGPKQRYHSCEAEAGPPRILADRPPLRFCGGPGGAPKRGEAPSGLFAPPRARLEWFQRGLRRGKEFSLA